MSDDLRGEELIAAIADELADGRIDMVARQFATAGAAAPHVLWRPTIRDIQHPRLAGLYRAASAVAGRAGGHVGEAFLDSHEFGAVKAWAMVLQIEDGGRDFRYLHYGSDISAAFGTDMTGRRTSELGGHISLFFIALYRAVLARGEWVKSLHEPPRAVFARYWRRLIVPIRDDGGRISRLAVANVADNELRAGLEAVPEAVLVVSDRGRVCLANRPALRLFGREGTADQIGFEAFTGLDVALPSSPEELVRQGGLRTIEAMMVQNRLIVRLQLTIGATFYRDEAYYVITARPVMG